MYFPYLYARKFELLALRELVHDKIVTDTVVPVLEPIARKVDDLRRAISAIAEARVRAIVVMNPRQGEFKTGSTGDLQVNLAEDFRSHRLILPGLICHSNVRWGTVAQFLEHHQNRDVALLYWNPRLEVTELRRIAATRRVRFNVVMHEQMPADLRSILSRETLVDIRDRFNAQPRNSDYDGSEFFSDSHRTFRDKAVGYGDFMTIGSEYKKGGGPAHAVAIHATYKQTRSGDIWVEHFVSDDTEFGVGTTAEKFLQAARKLVRAASRRRAEFGNNAALGAYAEYVRTNHFPGLGMNKQLQIHHHIALNHQVLSKEV
jgi:hypothetical protein